MGLLPVPERIPEADAWGGAIVDQPEMDMESYSRFAKKYIGGEYRRFINMLIDELHYDAAHRVLEVGPGPGWIGIWLAKRCPHVEVIGLELSPDMIRVAEKNCASEGVTNVRYIEGDAADMSALDDDSFDAVFSNGSMHHWLDPVAVFNEIARVLKPDGCFAINDGRRDIGLRAWLLMKTMTNVMRLDRSLSPDLRRGWKTSIDAGYTPDELAQLASHSALGAHRIDINLFDITLRS